MKSGKSGPLNGVFHYAERGGTFGGEVRAGLVIAFLAVCGMFMNMQAVMQMLAPDYASSDMTQIATNGEIVALTWFVSMLVAFAGSLIIGLVARMPLVQVTSLSLTTVIVSAVGVHSGLTYYNVLFLNLIASVIYAVVVLVPPVRDCIRNGLPKSVASALPAAAGFLLAIIAAQLSGIFSTSSASLPNFGAAQNLGAGSIGLLGATTLDSFSYTTDLYHPQMLLSALAGVVAAVIFLVLARRRGAGASGKALFIGTIFFLVLSVLLIGVNWKTMKMSMSFLWGRLWMVGAEDAMQAHLATVLGNLNVGAVIAKGVDFSGFIESGGNIASLSPALVLGMVFALMCDAGSTMDAVGLQTSGMAGDEKSCEKAYAVNAVTNVVASFVGATPIALGKESVAGAKDGARSGLTSVVASLVFLLSAFVWVVPAIFATITSYSITFNMYGHYGKVLQLLSQTSFTVADIVMAMVGLSMVAKTLEVERKGVAQTLPFAVTIGLTVLTTNIGIGVAAGCVANALILLRAPKRKNSGDTGLVARLGGIPTAILSIISLAVLVLTFVS